MHYLPADKYCGVKSLIHNLDPRVKIGGLVLYILAVVSTKPEAYSSFLLYGLLVFLLLFLSKIPLSYLLKRSAVVIPFVFFITLFIPFLKEGEVLRQFSFGTINLSLSREGLMIAWNVLIKSYLSIVVIIIMVSSGNFADLLKGLERMGVPSLFIMVISFMYRYLFIIGGTLTAMKNAKDSRSVGGARWLQTRALGNMVGTLFIRSYERGEKVYLAMCARGFDGTVKTMAEAKLKRVDIIFISTSFILLSAIFICGRFYG